MADDMLPNATRASVRELSESDIYYLGQEIARNPHLARVFFDGMGSSTQRLTSTTTTDIGFPNRLISVAADSERGLMQTIATFLDGLRWRFRSVYGSRDVTSRDGPSPTMPIAVAWKLETGFSEVLLNKNQRAVVPLEEIKIGSLLRGVVRISVRLQTGPVFGTGVLIDDLTVATVGHLLVDTYGNVQGVTIWAGQGDGDNTIEDRDGIYVAVHNRWYRERRNSNDLAFIRLSKPFGKANPIKYMQTPVTHNGIDASIYGFPYDLPEKGNERGKRLCVSESAVRYSLSDSVGMLEHEGDTEKGTSGGPVLNAEGVVIALHRGWDSKVGGGRINQAVSIDRDGNDFSAFRMILDYMAQRENDRVKILGEVKEVGGFAFMVE
ncbi:hypothetical protein ANO14919_100500 [Xylariales sp. No.14919]|nr:hypothetical protein ANO14919_100500 [Xylariales sp. No.14919]